MAENQHNDNLERFFKANLKGYAPTPSDDFWSRMEPIIPAKPPFWSGWWRGTGKWVGIAILAIIAVLVLWFWHRDHTQIEKLKRTVAQQEQRLQALDTSTQPNIPGKSVKEIHTQAATPPTNEKAGTTILSQVKNATISHADGGVKKPLKSVKTLVAKKTESVKNGANQSDLRKEILVQSADKQQVVSNDKMLDHQSSLFESTKEQDISTPSEVNSNLNLDLGNPALLSSKNSLLTSKKTKYLAVKPILVRPTIDYPKFSVEAGATAFRLPLGRLFQQDTFLTGRTGLSCGTGFKINYELNSHTTLQTGYQFINLRARRLALRYNSFPVAVVKRWAWGRRRHVEGKLGASINSLVSARTDSDGQSVKGLKPTWIGVHAGVAATWSISENLDFIVGPNAGFSLSPMTTGRRSWDIGVGAGLRYQL